MNIDSLFGQTESYLSEKISFMYETQCVHFDGCKISILLSVLEGPSLKYTPTSVKDKDQRT